MRVLLGTSLYDPDAGGKENYLDHLARGLREREHEVRVLARFDSWNRFEESRLRFEVLSGFGRTPAEPLDPPSGLRPIAALLGALVVRPRARTLAARLAARLYGMRCLDAVRWADVVHFDGIGFELIGFAFLLAVRRIGRPLVVVPHLHVGQWGDGTLDQALYREARAVIAKTSVEADRLLELGLEARRVHVIGNAPVVDPTVDSRVFREEYGIEGPIVLFLGRKSRVKGYPHFREAARQVRRKHPEVTFVAMGRKSEEYPPQEGLLEIGFVGEPMKSSALAACDLLCLPSRGEAFGMVYLEAWAFGKPVVAGDTDQVRTLVADGVDGWLVEDSAESTAAAILEALADPEGAERMGARGRRKVQERFTWDQIVEETLSVYRGAVDRVPEPVGS